ncbi:MAG: trimethylamine methyltransferase family protein, partial [Actinomycetota bacterium]
MTDVDRTKRSGGRAGRQTMRSSHEPGRDAFITRLIKPYELVSDEGLEIIEHNADTILEEVGIEVRDYPSAIARFKDAGADVTGTRVRFPRGMCRKIVSATAPSIYTQHA